MAKKKKKTTVRDKDLEEWKMSRKNRASSFGGKSSPKEKRRSKKADIEKELE